MIGHRPIRYTLVGVWNSVFGFAIYSLVLLLVPTLPPTYVLIITSPMSILHAYLTQRRFVWHSHASWIPEVPPFVSVYLVSLGINAVLLTAAVSFIPPIPAQALSLAITAAITYFVHRAWTFRHSDSQRGRDPLTDRLIEHESTTLPDQQ